MRPGRTACGAKRNGLFLYLTEVSVRVKENGLNLYLHCSIKIYTLEKSVTGRGILAKAVLSF